MINKEDKLAIEFIQKFKVATTKTLYELFYPSLRTAQHRLTNLVKYNELKRGERYNVNREYLYYISKPKQLRHMLLLTEFYREIHKLGVNVKYFDNEVVLDDIRPDGLIAYTYNNKNYIAFVEVEISNKRLDVDKYIKFYKTRKYISFFPVFPQLIAITNKNIPDVKEFKIINIKEDLNNIKDIIKTR